MMLQQTKVDELVSKLVQAEGSDLHLKVGAPPVIRVHGELEYLEGYEVLRPMDTDDILKDIIPEKLVGEFEEDGEADFSYAVTGVGRFRVGGGPMGVVEVSWKAWIRKLLTAPPLHQYRHHKTRIYYQRQATLPAAAIAGVAS